ncbi:MAG: AAA family ATPase [Desulfococcaceae bacterium]
MTNGQKTQLLTPEEIRSAEELISGLLTQLDRMILGSEHIHRMLLIALLSRGHVLLEGVPGVGKTLTVRTLSRLLGLDFKRVQFTPDLMPGDIVGNHILQTSESGERKLVFQKGPVFTHILLADEINRASPKTQSALLEAMQEQSVTLLGMTRELPNPFFVLATQNPIEMEGTYPLPEAQVDRFLFKLNVDTVSPGILEKIITTRRRGTPPEPGQIMNPGDLENLFAMMERMALPVPVARYISRLVGASHPESPEATEMVKNYVSFGASPRAAIGIAEAARGYALICGRPAAGFEDVKSVAPHALNHRLILSYKARIDRISSHSVLDELLACLDETGMNLPDNVEVR